MPSHNQRSSSTRPSRSTSHTTPSNGHVQGLRTVSVPPARQFIIILTNNTEILRQTTAFQTRTGQQRQSSAVPVLNGTVPAGAGNNTTTNNSNQNDRERLLTDLFRMALREVARDYLTRTRRSYPIHYVYDMSDIDLSQS